MRIFNGQLNFDQNTVLAGNNSVGMRNINQASPGKKMWAIKSPCPFGCMGYLALAELLFKLRQKLSAHYAILRIKLSNIFWQPIIIIIIIIIITNLYTGCTFQHKNAVINMCPVKE